MKQNCGDVLANFKKMTEVKDQIMVTMLCGNCKQTEESKARLEKDFPKFKVSFFLIVF